MNKTQKMKVRKTKNLKERIDALPYQQQIDLLDDIHGAIEERLKVYEGINERLLKEHCEAIEARQYSKEAIQAMKKAFPNVELPKIYKFSQSGEKNESNTKI